MSQVTPNNQFAGSESPQSQLNRSFGTTQALNGGLDFGLSSQTLSTYTGNIAGQWIQITIATANVEVPVPHGLGRIPNGYIVFWQNAAGSLYQGPTTGTAWTTTNIYVKGSVSNVVFQVFVT